MAEEFTYQVDFFNLSFAAICIQYFFFCLDFYPVALLSYFPLVFFLVKKKQQQKTSKSGPTYKEWFTVPGRVIASNVCFQHSLYYDKLILMQMNLLKAISHNKLQFEKGLINFIFLKLF